MMMGKRSRRACS